MITNGNLSRTAKAFSVDTSAPRDPRALQEALVFASICAAFALGAATIKRPVNIGLVVPIGHLGTELWSCVWDEIAPGAKAGEHG